jgi:hypothetical protein
VPADPLRARLIAALRPRMTLVEAQVAVDGLLPTFLDYVTETVDDALRKSVHRTGRAGRFRRSSAGAGAAEGRPVITRYVTAHLTVIGFSVVLLVVVVWLVVLSLALAEQRRRHDRLVARVSGLSKSVGAIQRRRHNTGTQSAVDTAGQTRTACRPAPRPRSPSRRPPPTP